MPVFQSQQSLPITMVAACGAHTAPPYDDARVRPEASVHVVDACAANDTQVTTQPTIIDTKRSFIRAPRPRASDGSLADTASIPCA